MKIDFTKDWCVRMAQMEMDAGTDMEIGATCEATARAFDARETGRAYARVTARKPVRSHVPLISDAVKVFLDERVGRLQDGTNSAANLAHLYPFYADRTLDQLGAVAREYATQGARQDGGRLLPATIRQRLATLRSAATYALKYHGMGSMDWIAAMPMPTVQNARERHLSRAEVLRIARACRHRPARALILMTFATGGRPGEIHRAEPGDGFLAKRLKNGDLQRMPFPAKFGYLLRYWPMDYGYETLSRHWRRALKAAGLTDVHLHDLRHSTASNLAAQGANLLEIGLVLNHRSAQSTKRYAHLSTDAKAKVLGRIWRTKQKARTRA